LARKFQWKIIPTVDKPARKTELIAAMRRPVSKTRKKLTYPNETEGSRIAAAVRKEASKLTAEQRRELFKQAMVRIYGGQPKGTTGARHPKGLLRALR